MVTVHPKSLTTNQRSVWWDKALEVAIATVWCLKWKGQVDGGRKGEQEHRGLIESLGFDCWFCWCMCVSLKHLQTRSQNTKAGSFDLLLTARWIHLSSLFSSSFHPLLLICAPLPVHLHFLRMYLHISHRPRACNAALTWTRSHQYASEWVQNLVESLHGQKNFNNCRAV